MAAALFAARTAFIVQRACTAAAPSDTVLTAWHACEAQLAVATAARQVCVYSDLGERQEVTVKRDHSCTALAWHPEARVLAIGWDDGKLSLWDEPARKIREPEEQHARRVRFLAWNAAGTRLASGDDGGRVVLWVYEKSVAHLLCQCTRDNAAHTVALFGRGGRHLFFGGEKGNVYVADEQNNLRRAGDFGDFSPVHSLFAWQEAGREELSLVAVTKTSFAHKLALGVKDRKWSREAKAQLSRTADGTTVDPNLRCAWLGEGALATCSGGVQVDMWDVPAGTHYALALPAAAAPDERVCSVAYGAAIQLLAAGTSGRRVFFWELVPRAGEAVDADAWVPLAAWADLPGRPGGLSWCPGRAVLAVEMPESVAMLAPGFASHALYGGCVAYQLRPSFFRLEDAGALERGGDVLPVTIECSSEIVGAALHQTQMVMWTGKRIEVYDTHDPTDVRHVASFSSRARAAAVHNEDVIMALPQRLEFANQHGVTKQTIPFTDTQGDPIALDVAGKFLVAATTGGWVQVFDLSRREARPHGSGRSFGVEDGIERVASVRVNAKGTHVSLLCCAPVPASSHAAPSTAVFVWEVDRDILFSKDFAPATPVSHFWDLTEPRLLVVESQQCRGGRRPNAAPLPRFADEGAGGGTAASSAVSSEKGAAESTTSGGAASAAPPPVRTAFAESSSSSSSSSAASSSAAAPAAAGTKDDGTRYELSSRKLAKELAERERAAERRAREGVASQVHTIFVMVDADEVQEQDSHAAPWDAEALLGLVVPHVVFVRYGAPAERRTHSLWVTMRDFVGMENVDAATRDAILLFSYYVSVGDMDRAYKAVKLIRSANVWENMARMCVKTRRIDVVDVCLANMDNVRGTRALREAKEAGHPVEAQLAAVAIELGLYEDAEELYHACGRWDLLNGMFQARGDWARALEVARAHDRIHLKTTHFLYAKHFEAHGDIPNAIKHFEASDTHRQEVPRMLFEQGRLQDLETFVDNVRDPELMGWWARYNEGKGRLDTALAYYKDAEDFLSIARVYCVQGRLDEARRVAEETKDLAACYHLARYYQHAGDVAEAIGWYNLARCFNHGLRLAMEEDLDAQVFQIGVQASPKAQVEAAKYFEEKEQYGRAVVLFNRGGALSAAVDLAFRKGLHRELGAIAGDMPPDTDPAVLQRCSEFFMENGNFDKAVQLYVAAGAVEQALRVAEERKVIITEEMANRMVPPADADPRTRARVLVAVAKTCKHQGSYHLSGKMYALAKDRVRAMKVLLKSGDTDRIIFFANVSRQRDLYVMAANYLQSLDWRTNPSIMAQIITFYKKANAPESIALFYSHCAVVEIDEYENYEKALGALKEALKYLQMVRGSGKETKVSQLKSRIAITEQYLRAKRAVQSNDEGAVELVKHLVARSDLWTAVHRDDITALLKAAGMPLPEAEDDDDAAADDGVFVEEEVIDENIRECA